MHLSFFKFCWCSLRLHKLCVPRPILIILLPLLLNCVYLLLLATFLFQSLSSCDGRSSRSPTSPPLFQIWGEALWRLRARWTLLDVVQSISHTKSGCFSTCFIDSAIFYLFPIFLHVFHYLFIISSSILEQTGFSEI